MRSVLAKVSFNSIKFEGTEIARLSSQIFEEIRFIRLNGWRECGRSAVLGGGNSCAGQIFRRFELKKDSQMVLEFWYRGAPISEASSLAFQDALLTLGELEESKMESLSEVWKGSVGERVLNGAPFCPIGSMEQTHDLESARIGALAGRPVLAMWWQHLIFDRKFLSLYILSDTDSRTVYEVHFSAPTRVVERHASSIIETLRSFQWSRATPPPVVSSSRRSA